MLSLVVTFIKLIPGTSRLFRVTAGCALPAFLIGPFRLIVVRRRQLAARDGGIIASDQSLQITRSSREGGRMRVLTCSSDNPLLLDALWGTFIHRRRYGMHEEHKHLILRALGAIKAASREGKKQPENVAMFESQYDLFRTLRRGPLLQQSRAVHQGNAPRGRGERECGLLDRKGLRTRDISIKMIDSWFVDYEEGGFVLPHAHGGSWSCVYYLQSNDNDTARNRSTYLLSPRGRIGDRHDLGNSYMSSSSFTIPAREGELIVFLPT